MSYNYQTEVPINNNASSTVRSLSVDHPDNMFLAGFKQEADLHELEDLLNEVIIRFDTNPDNYLKDDYMHLIALLYRNFLVIKGFNDRVDGVDQIINDLDVRITKNEGDIVNINTTIEQLDALTVKSIIPIKYSELLEKVVNSELLPGQDYRITDYTFTTTQEFTSSAGHDFDIIVSAVSTNTLSENAKAVCKENDNYFKNSKLNLWELKYSIYNDKNKYGWADENGKGVVYWLKDEFNNEAGYDFKSALFKKSVQRDESDYKVRPYIEGCSQYITFNNLRSEQTDLSLVGNFTNCKIDFQKKLPFIKLTNKGFNINISGSSAYIYNGFDIDLKGSVNYIYESRDLNLNTDYTTILNSQEVVTKNDNQNHYIDQCAYIQLGFNNQTNYLVSCQYITTNGGVSKLDVRQWYFCKIDSEIYNLISQDIALEYSTIGYNNQNVTFIGTGTFKNKTISPSTFTTSWQEPNYEFEFNSDIADDYETISKKQFITYID